MKRVLVFGGSGHMGAVLNRNLDPSRYHLTIVTRNPRTADEIAWDGKTLGDWTNALETTDAVINLAGRRVHCRYNKANLQEMMESRIQSAQVIGQAIARAKNPPAVWLQASTATIYAHTFGDANDELTGVLGGGEPGVPEVWNFSIQIAKNWEAELDAAEVPGTRKIALRTAIMMGIDKDSAFDIFSGLAGLGLSGKIGNGQQFVSWIHEVDLARSVEFLIESDISRPVNLASPNPVAQAEFAKDLRAAWGVQFGLSATPWMAAIGAWLLNGDTELVMKSRRVIPTRLTQAGFQFKYPTWSEAARDLAARLSSSNH
jgi:uncharacterized protein (TIGR01777 family)